tara:strand:+ start:11163 stop:12293 length:1131 start_codon:yes stop_codon:yes gene_type:complete
MKKLTTLLLSVLVFLSCTNKQNPNSGTSNNVIINPEYGDLQSQESPPINFELVQTFGNDQDDENTLFIYIKSIFVDTDQNIYALDPYSPKLISYSKTGAVRWIVDSPGKGPGDLDQPKGMVWNNNNLIYLSNINGHRIDVFNLEGEFVESLSLPESKRSLEPIGYSDEKLILATEVGGAFAKKFSVFDINNLSSPKTTFTIDETGDIEVPVSSSWFSQATLLDGEIVYGGVSEYKYSFVNLDSTKDKTVQREFGKIVRPGFFEDDEGSVIGALGGMRPPLKLSSGHYLTSASWPVDIDDPDAFIQNMFMGITTEYKLENTIDLFDKNWNLLYSIESEEPEHPDYGAPQFVDSEGYLYSIFTIPFAHIKKFSITINE